MTALGPAAGPPTSLDGGSRAEAKRVQVHTLPDGPTVVSCSAPLGAGGLGLHLAELLEALRSKDSLSAYLCPAPADDGAGIRVTVSGALIKAPPIRFSPSWRVRVGNAEFDRAGARALPSGAEHLLVFNGHAGRHITAARRLGYRSVGLISANSHLAHVARQHRKAYRQYPIERGWSLRSVSSNLKEYAAADTIYVSSSYAWESFTARGIPEDRLRFWPLTAHPRFGPRAEPAGDLFTVVYVGSLAVHKGVPLLIDAFQRLPYDDLRLVLVGGYGTRGMRRHLQTARARDPRITVSPGDPLPHLRAAAVCVHPSYEEGFGYAPAEALACGVPTIVSEDTGMKELIRPGVDGLIIPTGDVDALTEALAAVYRGEWNRA